MQYENAPEQTDRHSCGIFIMAYAMFIARQKEMPAHWVIYFNRYTEKKVTSVSNILVANISHF